MVESMKFMPAQVLHPGFFVIDSKATYISDRSLLVLIRAGSHLRGKRTDSVFRDHAKLHHI